MKRMLFSLCLLLTTAAGFAAESDNSSTDKDSELHENALLDIEFGLGTRYQDLQQAFWGIDVGYLFANRVYPYFRYEGGLMLYKMGAGSENKHYANTVNIGGGLGYVLTRSKTADKFGEKSQIDFTANVTSSVGGDYKHTSYYGGFRVRTKNKSGKENWVSLGYRRCISREEGWHDYGAFVFTLGW